MNFLGENYFILCIKKFKGKGIKLITMPSTAMISQYPGSRILIYFNQHLETTELVKYDEYWEVVQVKNTANYGFTSRVSERE